jgi:hypothetical protein
MHHHKTELSRCQVLLIFDVLVDDRALKPKR